MIYIFKTEFTETKSITIAAADIKGLSLSTSKHISKKHGFLPNLKTKHLRTMQVIKLKETINNLDAKLGKEFKQLTALNIERLISIKSYKGLRMFQGLPIRGQRTHSNARTAKKFKRK